MAQEHSTPPLGDFEVSLLESPRARNALFYLFLLALVMDFDLLFMSTLARLGIIHPSEWGFVIHMAMGTLESVAIIAATVLWLVMFFLCMRDPERTPRSKAWWGLAFVLGFWFGAQIYYFFPFRQFLSRHHQAA
jgi:hypothetical protein